MSFSHRKVPLAKSSQTHRALTKIRSLTRNCTKNKRRKDSQIKQFVIIHQTFATEFVNI